MGEGPFPQPAASDIRLTTVLRALADPGRVKIVQVLADGGYHGCTVESFGLDIQKSTLSHHLRTLREAGITTVRVNGRNHTIALRIDDLNDRFPGLLDSLTTETAIADVQGAEAR